MSRNRLPKSVRATAAASVIACTVGLAAEHAEAEVLPVWIDAPHLEGTYQPIGPAGPIQVAGATLPITPVTELSWDFDQDGISEFVFNYYFPFGTSFNYASETLNESSDLFYSSIVTSFEFPSNSGISFEVIASTFDSREAVFESASTQVVLPRPLKSAISPGLQNQFRDRGILGMTFEAGDGKIYVGYLDIEIFDDNTYNASGLDDANNYLTSSFTIYDAGYALVPEPSSLALLGLGGVLLARRRRG